MTLTGYFAPRRTWPTAPEPTYDQDAKRERRRRWLPVALDGDFDLAAEVDAIVGPLATRVAAQPNARGYIGYAETIADQVGELCGAVAELVGDPRTNRLSATDRRRARDAMKVVTRSSVPTITADALAEASWVEPLVALARRSSDPLAAALGRQPSSRRGEPTASDTVLGALRDLDRAALDLVRRLDRSEFLRAQFGDAASPQRSSEQAAQETLRELGLDTVGPQT